MVMTVAKLSVEDLVGDRSPGRLLRRINRLMMRQIEARFAASDLPFEAWISLKMLHDGMVTTAGDLSREIGIATGATTRLIDCLETRGLVARDRTSTDRRVVRLALTNAGEAKYYEKLPMMLSAWNEILEDFEDAEVRQMIALLKKLLASFAARCEKPAKADVELVD